MSDFLSENKLTKWFLDGYAEWSHSRFPGGGKHNYADIFKETDAYLNREIHPHVETGAAAREQGLFLTDHGPDHIRMVIRRAQRLLPPKQCLASGGKKESGQLEPHEIFLLLTAIHFHDVGNWYGRDGHEKRITTVMEKVPSLQSLDRFEQGAIARIATCHGGKIEGDPDTIGRLPLTEKSGDISYRPRLIAALLRLSDELADERSRAHRFGLQNPDEFPNCLVYHKYAFALASVDIEQGDQQVELRFQISQSDANRTFPIWRKELCQSEDVYLLDYIYRRTLKTYREMIYCSQYMRDLFCRYNQVAVRIDALCDEVDFEPAQTISYRIGEYGYPDDNHGTLKSLAPKHDEAPSGKVMAELLRAKCKQTQSCAT